MTKYQQLPLAALAFFLGIQTRQNPHTKKQQWKMGKVQVLANREAKDCDGACPQRCFLMPAIVLFQSTGCLMGDDG